MPIRLLSPEIANQIAAGEVVERPASAVKELLENSLDAGASEIRVEIREGGRSLIRVQDDGGGIPSDEVSLAFQRHATSKITSTEDLSHITTLGFRGEALASIAAVAHVTLLSRLPDAIVGSAVRVVEGRYFEEAPRGMPPGTSVTVEHLFANVPARLKFLKQPATEAAHIQQVITRYALAFPERRFSFVSDGKLLFQSSGSGKLQDVIAKVYGLELAKQMLPFPVVADEAPAPHNPSGIHVMGFTSVPGLHRGNRSYITLFVNRRWFQDSSIAYAVIQAYHTILPVGRYPVAVVFLDVHPEDVDVNVHPTKAEVRFRDPGAAFSAVQRAVRRAVVAHAPIPALNPPGDSTGASSGSPSPWRPSTGAFPGFSDTHWLERRDALLHAGSGLQEESARSSSVEGKSGATETGSAVGAHTGAAIPPSDDLPSGLMPLLRVVGQLGATYIVAEGPDGMYLLDQHAAHERVLYEQLLAQYAGQEIAVQALLDPLVIDFNPEQASVAAEHLATLNALGVLLEPFGGGSYLLRGVPAVLARESDPTAALIEIVDGLARRDDLVEATQEAQLVTLICKRAAVKGATPLTLPEMQALVRRLEGCRSPRTCPHGRPTMVYMSGAELARQFGRT